MSIVFQIVTFITSILAISFVLKGEDSNHKLYSLYLGICSIITAFCNLPALNSTRLTSIDILKSQPIPTLVSLMIFGLISFISSLIAFRFSANTTNSKFTYFIKFYIIHIILFAILFFGIDYIISLF